MIYLNKNEEKIIGNFIKNSENYEHKPMLLKWNNGSVIYAIYESYIEDENDYDMNEREYEEFWSFIFKIICFTGKPNVFITEDNYFLISYHNFPDEILVNGKKIN